MAGKRIFKTGCDYTAMYPVVCRLYTESNHRRQMSASLFCSWKHRGAGNLGNTFRERYGDLGENVNVWDVADSIM